MRSCEKTVDELWLKPCSETTGPHLTEDSVEEHETYILRRTTTNTELQKYGGADIIACEYSGYLDKMVLTLPSEHQ